MDDVMDVILKVTSYGKEFLPIVGKFAGFGFGYVVIDDRGKTQHLFQDEIDSFCGEFVEGEYYMITRGVVEALREEYKK
ncbi:hypothetical protein IKE71_04145 [Candidatus Saccharibacteria bacterium]|nr:hypothetical protein [Candidatus Saccharibacteria bacterium]